MKLKLFSALTCCLVIVVLSLYQCQSNKFVPDVCFNKNILPIFVSKCTTSGCHDGSGKGEQALNFTNYEGIMKKVKPYHPLLSEVYTQCKGNNPSMPPAPNAKLTDAELTYIKYWIHTGAKNLPDCGVTTCDTTNYSFSNRIAPLLNTWCIGCHNSSNAGGGYDLSSYAGVKSAITPSNKLTGSINQSAGYSAMPKGSTKLSDCDLNAIQKWIDAGYPNN